MVRVGNRKKIRRDTDSWLVRYMNSSLGTFAMLAKTPFPLDLGVPGTASVDGRLERRKDQCVL